MKPDWDKLMGDFKDSATQLVADVDCTAEGKALCDANGVRGYPTIKWGDPSALEDYQGGRDYDSLKKFADENLKPMCSPANIDLCDKDKQKEIKKYQAMKPEDLDKEIKAKEDEIEAAEKNFSDEVQKLQDAYQKLSTEKDEKLAAIKDSGLGLMKAVAANAKKGDSAKSDL